jgi:hypothetical protein
LPLSLHTHPSPPPTKRSRKITLEDLKAPEGLPELYATLPSRFRRLASGRRGEEGPDLARLVDLYAAWGRRLAPALAFPALLDSLEALGRTGAVKLELRELRAQALAPLESVGREGEGGREEAGLVGGWLGGGETTAAATATTTTVRPASPHPAFIAGGVDEDDAADDDDDDDDDLDDDELLELQAAPVVAAAAGAPVPAPVVMPEEEDEEALVALFEGASQEEEAAAPAGAAGPGPEEVAVGEQPAVVAPAAPAFAATLPPPTAPDEDALLDLFASQIEAE